MLALLWNHNSVVPARVELLQDRGTPVPTLRPPGQPFLLFLTLLSSPFGFLHSGLSLSYLQLSGPPNAGLRLANSLLISTSFLSFPPSEGSLFFLGIYLACPSPPLVGICRYRRATLSRLPPR